MRTKKIAVTILKNLPLILIGIVLLFPYFFMVMKSFMPVSDILDPKVKFFPTAIELSSYSKIFAGSGYAKALFNTLMIIGFNIVVIPLSASIIAYSFAKLRYWGRNFLFAVMLGTMMLPSVVTQIPLYVMYAKFGWLNTFLPLTIPNMFGGGAIFIFLIRQFMMGIPADMENAAMIDGANAWNRYWKIVRPLCTPVFIYIVLNVFITYWGDFYGPLIYMSSSTAPRTLAYVVFLDSTQVEVAADSANVRMAAGVFMSVFPTVLFLMFQRQLIEGVVMTGIKG